MSHARFYTAQFHRVALYDAVHSLVVRGCGNSAESRLNPVEESERPRFICLMSRRSGTDACTRCTSVVVRDDMMKQTHFIRFD